MQGMIERKIAKKLRATIAQVPAVALLGARQVGKTTLAKTDDAGAFAGRNH
jgi:predicted AAA+ superfamily ATPase